MSVNTKAGFSIVKYKGTLSASVNSATIPHGLSGCDFCMIKNLDNANAWIVSHSSIAPDVMCLNDPGIAASTPPIDGPYGQITELNSDTITITNGSSGGDNVGKEGSWNYIAYCWHSVPGYSAFGSYIGNNGGNFIYTGFRPAFVMFKKVNVASESWVIADNARDPANPTQKFLLADDPAVENSQPSGMYDFLSNGFVLKTQTQNNSGTNFVYMAFAEQPGAFSNAR